MSVISEALLMSTEVFLVLISRNHADIHNWELWLVTLPESFFLAWMELNDVAPS